jgi:putative oxidoreductase
LGLIFLMHGGHKLSADIIGGVAAQLAQLGSPLPLPAAVGVSLVELVCGAALVLGLFTRWASIILAAGMLVDVLLVHLPYGFFIANGGYEFALLRLAASLVLALAGPGKAALDDILAARRKARRRSRGAVYK